MNTKIKKHDQIMLVDGYATEKHFAAFAVLNDMMEIDGGVAEIGTYYGKSFLMLNSFVKETYQSFAIDLYGDQEKNVSVSGDNHLTAQGFQDNLEKYDYHKGKNVEVIKCDTLSNSRMLKDRMHPHPLKFFMVDGGHDYIHATNDLKIAEECISDGGIVILDDFFHPQFPGPTQALYKYMENGGALQPFFCVDKTLFLCSLSYREKYFRNIFNFTLDGSEYTKAFKEKFKETTIAISSICGANTFWYI
ncbi:class I SAM-dependent methyltransferase [bacterium]|nr:class I SAM-dependent methyltransferase [bacterium]